MKHKYGKGCEVMDMRLVFTKGLKNDESKVRAGQYVTSEGQEHRKVEEEEEEKGKRAKGKDDMKRVQG